MHGEAVDTRQETQPIRKYLDQSTHHANSTRDIMVMKNTGRGEIIQVQGGHILRSTGRKDRHSKVVTAKGPRDRRVRLAAHTAIQFYDVQDRLGYDRPSKAVDWLIKKAQNAIEKLDELPPWNPIDTTTAPSTEPNADSTEMASGHQSESSSGYAFQIRRQFGENPDSGSTFLPSSMDTQSIADTMKSFFPASSGTSSMNFQDYPPEIMARTTVQNEDLCLSLHSLQDPSSSHHTPSTDQTLFPGSAPVTFGANYPRLVPWNGGGRGENREGYIFSSQSLPPQPFLCQSSVLSQRGPLQSSFLPSVHAWNDHSIHHSSQAIQQSSISDSQFASQDVLQFQIHQQLHSEEQPSYASPNCHH